jgi:uncharacterized membrane protein YfhO
VDALNFIKARDKSFYRIDKSYASSPAIHYSLNDGMAQGYNGTSGYGSFNQLYYIKYLQLMGASDRNNEQESRWARGLFTRPILESANRVKYMLAKNDVPPLWRIICDTIGKFGDVTVYKNKFLLPFGYTYKQFIREGVFDKLNNTQKDFITLQACVVSDEDAGKLKGMTEFNLRDTIPPTLFNFDRYMLGIKDLGADSLVVEKFEDSYVSGKINLSSEKMLYLSVPYDDGWQLKVDGRPGKPDKVFAGMIGVMLPAGQHTIEMSYHLRYLSLGIISSVAGLILCLMLWFFTRKKQAAQPIANAE